MPTVVAHPKETKEQVKSLFLQGLPPSRIEVLTGIKRSTIGQWAARLKWVSIRDGLTLTVVKPGGKTVLSEPASRLDSLSQSLREQMADILQVQTTKLAKLDSPSTVNAIRAIATTLEPLARTAKLVHDWGSDRPIGIVLAGELAAVNVQATISSVPDSTSISQCSQDVVDQPGAIEYKRYCAKNDESPQLDTLSAPVPESQAGSDGAPGAKACLPGPDAPDPA